MTRIYKVVYEEAWSFLPRDFRVNSMKVTGGNDAIGAYEKVKKIVMKQTYTDDDKKIQKVVGFRLREIIIENDSMLTTLP